MRVTSNHKIVGLSPTTPINLNKDMTTMLMVDEEKQYVWDKTFIQIARLMAEHSTCTRKKVGAVLVKDNRIVSTGYNGTPRGLKHCYEIFTPDKMSKPNYYEEHGKFSQKYEVHAEQNCIIFAGKVFTSCEGCTLYTTLSTCRDCAKLVVASGISRVVYDELYDRDQEGINLLELMGIQVDHFVDKGDNI